jgi:hypothetical protein
MLSASELPFSALTKHRIARSHAHPMLGRRAMLRAGVAALLRSKLAAADDVLLRQGGSPQNLATPLEYFDRLITPTPVFFVRSHFGPPALDPKEIDPVVAYLASTSGPGAPPGPFVPETMPAGDALTEIAALPDDPIPPGDVERGKALFVNKCSACHGTDARGALGVALVDKPILYRAVELSRTVRRGRGKMIAIPLSDAEIGDVLA